MTKTIFVSPLEEGGVLLGLFSFGSRVSVSSSQMTRWPRIVLGPLRECTRTKLLFVVNATLQEKFLVFFKETF